MNVKCRHHQSVKGEKENENIKLRKKIESLPTDKHLPKNKTTVWDRLSKINQVSSTGSVSRVENYRSHSEANTSQLLHSFKHSSIQQSSKPSKKPTMQKKKSFNKRLNNPQKTLLKKSESIRELGNDILARDLPFEEITNNSLSCDSTNEYKEMFSCSSNLKKPELSESTIEEYTLAPLLMSSSEGAKESNVSKFLQFNNKSMQFENTDIATDCDGRCKNPKLLRDILKTELENIFLQEFAIGNFLDKLEPSVSVNLQKRLKPSTGQSNGHIDHKNQIQKFEVDVVFKNFPSLVKEIDILKALGEKLETTLKTATIQKGRRYTTSDSTTQPFKVIEENKSFLKVKVKHDLIAQHFITISIKSVGIRQYLGIIHEYSVAQKSIVELKREASCQFFIPKNSKNIQFVKTSFKHLKETPKQLFPHIRPKKSQIAFNVLEQDPIFFFSSMNKLPETPCFSLKHCYQNNEFEVLTEQSGDSNTVDSTRTLSLEAKQNDKNFLVGKKVSQHLIPFRFNSTMENDLDNFFNMPTNYQHIICSKKRRRIRCLVTPMPICYNHCPKNSFVKTILVGFVQVSLFIIFIMALTHPGLRCLSSPL